MQAAGGASLSDAGPATHDDAAPPRRRVSVLLTVAVVVLLLDVATKILVVTRLSDREPVHVLGDVLVLRLVRNAGAAFGFAQGATLLFTAVAVIVVGVILRVAGRLRSTSWAYALGLVLGGAIGNLSDRLFRSPGVLRGHVVDFIELPHWPVFNLADSCIMTGGTLMVLLSLRGVRHDGTKDSAAPPAP
jgi:signal peptidase II